MTKWKKALKFQPVNRKKAPSTAKRYLSQKGRKNKKRKNMRMCHLSMKKEKAKKKISLMKRMKPTRALEQSSLNKLSMKMKRKETLKGRTTVPNSYPLNPQSNARCSSKTLMRKKKIQG